MDVLIGTDEGLFHLSDTGVAPVAPTETTAIDGEWAICEEADVVSLDSGVTASLAPLTAYCVATIGDEVLVGTSAARLYRVSRLGDVAPVDSFDAIPTRDEWYTPWGGPPDTRSVTVTAEGAPLVNVHVGGVWRADGPDGDGWHEVVPVDNDTHQVLASTDTVVIAAAVGFGMSIDDGRTFRWTDDGLHASYCRAVAVADDHVLVTASTGPFTDEGAVYRRPLSSHGPFERCVRGLPERFPFNLDTFHLAAVGAAVVLGTRDGRLFCSDDAGATWDVALSDLPPVRCVALR